MRAVDTRATEFRRPVARRRQAPGVARTGEATPTRAKPARRSNRALAVLGLLGALFFATFADAAWLRGTRAGARRQNAAMVAQLGLTDLCLFTEARYTRHLSQADLHSAFQDHPGALEHFPSGSLVSPPRSLTSRHANLDR